MENDTNDNTGVTRYYARKRDEISVLNGLIANKLNVRNQLLKDRQELEEQIKPTKDLVKNISDQLYTIESELSELSTKKRELALDSNGYILAELL